MCIRDRITGVILGFTVPALARGDERTSLAEHLEHPWRPVSAGFAVPIFALFAAGVSMSPQVLANTAGAPTAQGVALGLVFGKPVRMSTASPDGSDARCVWQGQY